MFDIGASELLLVVIVAIVVIGPKDLPLALRTAGRWIGKIRRVSGHFRSGIETMIREAELEEMERKWREQNAAIIAAQPPAEPAEEEGSSTPPAAELPAIGDEQLAVAGADPPPAHAAAPQQPPEPRA